MNHLLRSLAPLTDEAWAMVDDEAKTRLSVALGARKLVDFSGPHGWKHSATNIGRVGAKAPAPADGVTGRSRTVLPLAELRSTFTLSREEMDDASRGALDVDFDALDRAALDIAKAENAIVFDGWDEMGMVGIVEASSHEPIGGESGPERLAKRVAQGIASLKRSDISGPYALALREDDWVEATGGNDAGGAILFNHLRTILEGPIVWVPGIAQTVVLSMRGGDFVLDCGEDLSVGYLTHDLDTVTLYLQESISFRVATPEAAVALT